MNDGRSWQGNWKARLYERVHECGYTSLTDFAEAHPTATLVALVEKLGAGDVAAVQVFGLLLDEAERNRQVTRLVRSQLVREFSESLPNGWPAVMDDAGRFAVGKMRGLWLAFTPETHKERARQVMAALRAEPPPPGWRPLGPDDERLRTLLPDDEA